MSNDINTTLKDFDENGYDFEVSSSSTDNIHLMLSALQFVDVNKDIIPWKSLVDNEWLSSTDDVAKLASIISTQMMDTSASQAMFRKHEDANEILVDLWIKRIESKAASKIAERPYRSSDASPIDREFLSWLVSLSGDIEVINALPVILADNNIILIYEKALPGLKTDGAVFTLNNGVPVIGLSLRYPRLDYLWFTLLHELSHIVLHYDRLNSGIIEDLDIKSSDIAEIEANNLARDSIVPRYLRRRSEPWINPTTKSVTEFAEKLQRHPALIAGQIQFDLNKWSILRDVVDAVDTRDMVFSR